MADSYGQVIDGVEYWVTHNDDGSYSKTPTGNNGGGGGTQPAAVTPPAFDWSSLWGAYGDTNQQQFDWAKQQFGETLAEQMRQFNITHGLQQENLAEQIRQFDIVNKTNYATSMAEQIRQFDATHQLAQQGQKQDLAMGLLSGASALRGPADWLSYANYTSGGKDIFSQLYGDQASSAFGAPTGYSQPANVSDILKQLGVNLSPEQPAVAGNPGGTVGGGTAPAASQWYQQMIDWYDKTKASGGAVSPEQWYSAFSAMTGLGPDVAQKMYDQGRAYVQATGQRADAATQQSWLTQIMGQTAAAPAQGQMQALPVGQASPVASALQQATAPVTGLQSGATRDISGLMPATSGPTLQPGGVTQTGTDVMAPLPYQINPAVWDSMSSTAKQMILAAAGAGKTPSGAWDTTDYQNQLNASRPIGTAPKTTQYNWGAPQGYR